MANHQTLRNLGFRTEAFYMSESDPKLRSRLKKLHSPKKLSSDASKYKGSLPKTCFRVQ